MSVTGIVAALTAEARTLGPVPPARPGAPQIQTLPSGHLLLVSGMGAAAATHAAQALAAAGARGLLSFGFAGALDPALAAGAWLLPRAVTDGSGMLHGSCAAWRERLAAAPGASAVDGTLLSCAQPLTTPASKSQARARTGAVAVDMESFAIARVALEQQLQFAVARVVIDTAADPLPQALLRAANARGEVNLARLLSGLAARPADVLALPRLARRYRLALRSLRALAGTDLGLP